MLHIIRRIAKAEQVFEPAGHRHDSAFVREGLEAVFTVVGTVARSAYTTEGSVSDYGMKHYLEITGVSQTTLG